MKGSRGGRTAAGVPGYWRRGLDPALRPSHPTKGPGAWTFLGAKGLTASLPSKVTSFLLLFFNVAPRSDSNEHLQSGLLCIISLN